MSPLLALGLAHAGPPRFPTLEAHNLLDEALVLPADLGGEWNVVVLAYTEPQQLDVNTWMPGALALAAADPRLGVYEVPVIGGLWQFFGWQVDAWMKAGIPDPEVRRRTVTWYGDPQRVLRPLGLADTARIAVLLVDRAGAVAWQEQGPATADKLAALEAAVAGVLP